jgi:hypothetical protein
MDLSLETRNHALARLQEARVGVDNGAGENDLKRLQRKFQATKASFINVDVKERFMQSALRCFACGAFVCGGVLRRAAAFVVSFCARRMLLLRRNAPNLFQTPSQNNTKKACATARSTSPRWRTRTAAWRSSCSATARLCARSRTKTRPRAAA